jgi:hypothetical protein
MPSQVETDLRQDGRLTQLQSEWFGCVISAPLILNKICTKELITMLLATVAVFTTIAKGKDVRCLIR